jgi:hypothetical protein
LASATYGASGGGGGHYGLTATDVALNEPNHGSLTTKICIDFVESALLGGRQ